MKQVSKEYRKYFVAILLGGAACTANFLAIQIEPSFLLPVGNLFLFLAAGSLGTLSAAGALFVAELPLLLVGGYYGEALHTAVLVMIWSYLAARNSRYAGFPAVGLTWAVLFMPVLAIVHNWNPGMLTETTTGFARIAAGDVFLALVAGALLLNEDIWICLVQRPRRFSISQLLTHVITLIAVVAMGAALALPQLGIAVLSQGKIAMDLPALLVAFGIAVAVPAFVSIRLSDLIRHMSQENFSSGLLHHTRELSFSGLSSSFWRRKDSGDIAPKTPSMSDSDTQLLIQPNANARLSANAGICAVDNIGTVTFANRKFLKLIEANDREISGKKLDVVSMHPALHKQLLDVVAKTHAHGPQLIEIKLNKLPDSLRYFEIRTDNADSLEGSTLVDARGGCIITIKDITDRRTIETHLLQAQRLASLGNFIAGLGHAFNNALTAIVGKANFAQRCNDKAKVDKALEDIVVSALRAGERVHQLLDFAQGGPTLLKDFDLREFLTERLSLLRGLAGDRYEVSVTGTADHSGVHCDSNLLLQAVTNLVLNARDAYQDKVGTIEISVDIEEIPEDAPGLHVGARPGKFARLRIRDYGMGMSPDVLSKAFDPLFTTRKAQGRTGLGLSTVFAIVRAHDGFLTTQSHPGKGTTVSIYLPLVEVEKSALVAHENGHATPNGSGSTAERARILIVEDEEEVRALVCQMLAGLGYEVQSCASGDEALACCRTRPFDLVLVDMAMPRMDGAQLIAEIKSVDAQAKTLLMTGYGEHAKGQPPETPLLSKPFDVHALARAVQDVLSPRDGKKDAQHA